MECICETRGARGLGAIIASVVSSEHHSLREKGENQEQTKTNIVPPAGVEVTPPLPQERVRVQAFKR